MQLIKLLGSEEGREASQVQCQEASQPKQWQLEVGIWGCCQFLKDWCVWRAGHHVSGRKEAIFYPMVSSLMQKAAPEHQFCFAISKATQLPGYHEHPSDQLLLVPQTSIAVWFPKVSHEHVPQRVLPSWSKLFSDMSFSLWTTQILKNTASSSYTFEDSNCVSFSCVLPGTCPRRKLCGHDSKRMKGHDFVPSSVCCLWRK